jgi:CheY-like chemotaxis protein
MKCLLIDDDADDRNIFEHVAAQINGLTNIVTVADGTTALRMLMDGSWKPDLIFLDLNMPKMDGKQFLSSIKNEPGLSGIPVIIYSTSNSKQDKIETEKLGACGYLIKPFDISDLKQGIQHVLNNLDYYREITLKSCRGES